MLLQQLKVYAYHFPTDFICVYMDELMYEVMHMCKGSKDPKRF